MIIIKIRQELYSLVFTPGWTFENLRLDERRHLTRKRPKLQFWFKKVIQSDKGGRSKKRKKKERKNNHCTLSIYNGYFGDGFE